jgi:GNAT superfamily N-acetyltransferase
VAQGFSDSETPPEDVLEVLRPNAASAIGTCFLAWLDGQPAGGGAIYIHAGVAELGSTSTRSQFRGRGVQSALLYRRLAVASESGCDLAMVITIPGTASQRNVERIGFRLAYTKPVLLGHAS